MILSDCHLHTSFSGDCESSMEPQISAAIALGLKTICFTDHLDVDFPDKYGMDFSLDTPSYYNMYCDLKDKYEKKIELLFGVEYGLQDHLTGDFDKYRKAWPFDFIIGSSHLLNGEDPYYFGPDRNVPDRQLYTSYYESILKNLTVFEGFQSYGHLDYIVRYGLEKEKSYRIRDFSEIIDEILHLAIQKGVAIEVNSAGLKYGLGFAHPHPDILKRYRELGGELLTIGSDAHAPQHIAYGYETLSDYLSSLGFKYYTIFRERQPEFVPIG